MALTARAVETAKPRERAYKLADAQGLYLYVTAAGAKSWRADFTQAGKRRTRTYGRWPAVSLAQARVAHAEARDGAAGGPTFEAVMRDWLAIKLPALSNAKHQQQVQSTLERCALPALGKRPIGDIKRAELVDVVRAVLPAQRRGAAPRVETAHRVAGRLAMVFDYAQDAGLIEASPASGLARVLPPKVVREHMACIEPGEAGELLRAIDTYPEPVTCIGLLLAAHTFVRVGELLGMQWAERVADDVWVVPAARMKRRLPHVVPLSPAVQALLDDLRALTGHEAHALASSTKPGAPLSENTLLFALYRLGYRGRMTVHGFRSLASTVLNHQAAARPDVIERQLAHRETDAVRAAYNRAEYLPERHALMAWWSAWLQAQQRAHAGPLRASASRGQT